MRTQTSQLFELLKQTYPDRQWDLEPYTVQGDERHAIVFSHEGMSIHDPFSSDCSRFVQADRYGLLQEHAERMAQHNAGYEIHRLGAIPDPEQLFNKVSEQIQKQPAALADDVLINLGLYHYHTGGNCMAYALHYASGAYLLVTDAGGCALPDTMGEAMVGWYDANGDTVRVFDAGGKA